MRLKDKVAVITGAANGLGKETTILFANEGAKVVIADYDIEAAKKLEQDLIVDGFDVLAVKVDVADRDSVDNMVKIVKEKYNTIDILINNAGITRDKTLLKMTQEQWQEVIDVNQTGVFNCIQAIAPIMVKNNYGRIINTSSVVGTSGNIGQVNYAASKGAVIAMSKTLAKELGPKGITVNAVAPGFIMTDMVAKMPEKIIKMMEEKIPLGKLGEPIDIANAYLYLASDEAKYVNGTVLEVDGGILF